MKIPLLMEVRSARSSQYIAADGLTKYWQYRRRSRQDSDVGSLLQVWSRSWYSRFHWSCYGFALGRWVRHDLELVPFLHGADYSRTQWPTATFLDLHEKLTNEFSSTPLRWLDTVNHLTSTLSTVWESSLKDSLDFPQSTEEPTCYRNPFPRLSTTTKASS